MAIELQQVFEDIADDLGRGTGDTKLRGRFILATNRTLSKLAVDSDRSAKFATVDSITDSVALDSKYEYILVAGIRYYLIRMGQRLSDPKMAALLYRDSKTEWLEGIGDYMMDVDNIAQAVADADVIALGDMD